MIVLGERFGLDDDHSEVVPLGWSAQPVRTDPCYGQDYGGSRKTAWFQQFSVLIHRPQPGRPWAHWVSLSPICLIDS